MTIACPFCGKRFRKNKCRKFDSPYCRESFRNMVLGKSRVMKLLELMAERDEPVLLGNAEAANRDIMLRYRMIKPDTRPNTYSLTQRGKQIIKKVLDQRVHR